MGNDGISTEQVSKLAELTGLNTFIQSRKNGYSAILQPVGDKLSNNVRKNILLMRALLGEHRLLLLEEPFEHLEQPYKDNIIQYIKEDKSATVLIASQDEQLSVYWDTVLMINKNGEMVN